MKKATLIILMGGAFLVLIALAIFSYMVKKGDEVKPGSPEYARMVKKIKSDLKKQAENVEDKTDSPTNSPDMGTVVDDRDDSESPE